MTERPQLDWLVPADEWDRFVAYVKAEHGDTEGYVSREVERAIREWLDADEWAAIEEKVDRLVQAAGRTPENLKQKKRTVDHPSGEETTRVYAYVKEVLKEEFAADARDAGEYPGIYLARALRARREGGRSRRVKEKLGRIIDDATELLSEVDPEGDGMSLRERRTIAICKRLGKEFTQDDLDEAIAAVPGDSRPTLREYRERVLDHLDYTTHPLRDDLFVPQDESQETATETNSPFPDAPAIDRKDYPALSREQKRRGLRIVLARRAIKNDGRYRFDAEEIRRDVFNGQPSEGHARNLMDLAADAEGFEATQRYGKERLQVDLRDVTDEEILTEVRKMADGSLEETDPTASTARLCESNAAEPDETDANPGVDTDKPVGPTAILNDLDQATPVRTDRDET